MARGEVLRHPAHQRLVILREDLLRVSEGDHCLAALLGYLEYWTGVKLSQREQAQMANRIAAAHGEDGGQDEELWIYASGDELREAMLGMYAREKIGLSLKAGVDRSLIERRRNPKYAWDRTWQYRLNAPLVQALIDGEAPPEPRGEAREDTDSGRSSVGNPTTIAGTPTISTSEFQQAIPESSLKTSAVVVPLRSASRENDDRTAEPSDQPEPPGDASPPTGKRAQRTTGFRGGGGLGGGKLGGGGRSTQGREQNGSARRAAAPDWPPAMPDALTPALEILDRDGWAFALGQKETREESWKTIPAELVRWAINMANEFPPARRNYELINHLDRAVDRALEEAPSREPTREETLGFWHEEFRAQPDGSTLRIRYLDDTRQASHVQRPGSDEWEAA